MQIWLANTAGWAGLVKPGQGFPSPVYRNASWPGPGLELGLRAGKVAAAGPGPGPSTRAGTKLKAGASSGVSAGAGATTGAGAGAKAGAGTEAGHGASARASAGAGARTGAQAFALQEVSGACHALLRRVALRFSKCAEIGVPHLI